MKKLRLAGIRLDFWSSQLSDLFIASGCFSNAQLLKATGSSLTQQADRGFFCHATFPFSRRLAHIRSQRSLGMVLQRPLCSLRCHS